jgi:divalent metal cation (Fe/Co/Zn/Cd) transporter
MKAQFTMVALVGILIMLIVYSQLYPILEQFLTPLMAQVDPATATIISLIPLFIAVSILLSVLSYIMPSGRR